MKVLGVNVIFHDPAATYTTDRDDTKERHAP